jgi:hypothetical protein
MVQQRSIPMDSTGRARGKAPPGWVLLGANCAGSSLVKLDDWPRSRDTERRGIVLEVQNAGGQAAAMSVVYMIDDP